MRKTLLRCHAQHALDNALLDAIHAVRSKITACRSSWIEENAKGRDRVELAPVWETAWKEVWRDVSKQLSSLNNRNAQQWEELWDQVCAEKGDNNDVYRFEILRNKEFQVCEYVQNEPLLSCFEIAHHGETVAGVHDGAC